MLSYKNKVSIDNNDAIITTSVYSWLYKRKAGINLETLRHFLSCPNINFMLDIMKMLVLVLILKQFMSQ